MTVALAPNPFLFWVTPQGQPAVGYQLFTYVAGTSIPQATYTDSTQTEQNTNPVVLNAYGYASVWLVSGQTYKLVLTDVAGNLVGSQDQIPGGITAAQLTAILTQSFLGAILFPITSFENAVGVTPPNLYYIAGSDPAGLVDRFGTNTTPGTTNMLPALQTAINIALGPNGSGQSGVKVVFGNGAYLIGSQPTFGATTTNILPLDISGQGIGSQLICGFPTAGGLFNMTGKNGWYIHDLLICGNATNPNDGIVVSASGSPENIEWNIDRVTSMMFGRGIVCSNTNTGNIRGFRHWPGNNPTLIVPQGSPNSSVSHGIHLTGGFAHQIGIYDAVCLPDSSYNAAMRGIKCDANASIGVVIINPIVQTGSGLSNEIGIDYNPTGSATGLVLIGTYNEGTTISLGNVSQSTIQSVSDGGAGGTILLNGASRENTFNGINQAAFQGGVNSGDQSNWGNIFTGCNFRTTFNDYSEAANTSNQPNQFLGCTVPSFPTGTASLGQNWRKVLTYAATLTPSAYYANTIVIRATGNLTLNAPTSPRNGQQIIYTIRNEAGAGITVTFSGYSTAGWSNPANTFNRSICFQYDSDFAQWRQLWVGTVDIPN